MAAIVNDIRRSVEARSPLVYLLSPEEDRVMRALREIAGETGATVRTWTCVGGLQGADPDATRNPVDALMLVARHEPEGFFVFKDLAPFMAKDPAVARALRELYYASTEDTKRFVFVVSPELVIPESLRKEMHLVEIPPPDEREIVEQIETACAAEEGWEVPEDSIKEVTLALKGLTESEIRHVLNRVLQLHTTDPDELLDEIFAEKKAIVKKSGFLEFSPPRWDISGLGGLDNLKDWLVKRRKMFTREAVEAGVPVPKGILMMGISGCGKSLSVKVISHEWNIPLFRLDMNLVFSGMYGSPEEAFHRALKTVESVAPAVLWIDEIENALGIEESGVTIQSHIFSAFLTWMQEKPPMVFIAATANRIQALPAEIIRKGRFDQVFFLDLPADPERIEIFKIHLARNGADLSIFDYKMLAIQTQGWNGAEIEQAVIAARTEAFYEGRPFSPRDLDLSISKIVPLSETMEAQIKGIRSWAFSRATPASKYSKSRRM